MPDRDAEAAPVLLRCAECGAESPPDAKAWRAYLDDDGQAVTKAWGWHRAPVAVLICVQTPLEPGCALGVHRALVSDGLLWRNFLLEIPEPSAYGAGQH
jgi:hypothetical protein